MSKMAKFFLEKNSMALIEFENETYVSFQSFPFTPIIHLIDALYSRFPDRARLMVRSRIFCNYQPTVACLAAVKVSAKRLSFDKSRCEPRPWVDLTHSAAAPIFETRTSPTSPEQTEIVTDFEQHEKTHTELKKNQPQHQLDRPVRAWGYSSSDQRIWITRNLSSLNPMRHAEWCLAYSILEHRSRVETFEPLNFAIWVSLKPCKMCAAIISQLASAAPQGSTVQVKFLRNDPGPMATHTVLDGKITQMS